MTTAESLRRFLKSHNLRQVDVANALGITQQAYAVYEGGVDPGTKTLVKIADFLTFRLIICWDVVTIRAALL